MKKTLILASALILASSAVFAAEPTAMPLTPPVHHEFKKPDGTEFAKRHAEFEQRLKLTDEQKAKAKELREQGFEKIKPVMEKIKEKHAEIETVKRSRISTEAQNEKIEQIKREIGALKQEAHRLRTENMKSFEALLTKSQLKELKKMKAEGRKKFEKEFKKHPRPNFEPPLKKHRPTPLPAHRPVE